MSSRLTQREKPPEKWDARKKRVLSFDLETQQLISEVGRENLHKLRLSLGVTQELRSRKVHLFREERAEALVDQLAAADCIVGYNLHGFDYHVLQPYAKVILRDLPTVDLAAQIRDHLGRRIPLPLNEVCRTNLGETKSGDGLEAVALFRAGKFDKLEEYARQDVKLVTKLYELALRQRYLLAPIAGRDVEVPIDCAPPTPVEVKAKPPMTKRARTKVTATTSGKSRIAETRGPCSNCGSFNHTFDGSGIICDEDYFASKDD